MKYKIICSLKVPERYEKWIRVSFSMKEKSISTPPSVRNWTTTETANVGGDRMNPGIRILQLPSVNGLVGVWMNGYKSGQLLVPEMGNYP